MSLTEFDPHTYTTLFRSGLRLAHAGGAQEDERADGPALVRQPSARTPDGVGHRGDGLVLADDALMQLVLQLQELLDRKSTRLNSSHVRISYAVFCFLKKY